MLRVFATALTIAMSVSVADTAHAAVITFDNVGLSGLTTVGLAPVAVGSGFEMSASAVGPGIGSFIGFASLSGFGYVGAHDTRVDFSSILTTTSGDMFNLTSFRYRGYNNNTADSITVTGYKADGSSVISTFSINTASYPEPLTATLNQNFTGLTLVTFHGNLSFYQGYGAATYSLDDINVTALPEPATWAMMVLSFGLVGGAMRRGGCLALA